MQILQINWKLLLIRMSLLFILNCSGLFAIEIISEFYPAGQIPKEFDVPNQGDLTLLQLKSWPTSNAISITENRNNSSKSTEKGKVPPGENSNFRYAVYSLGYFPGEPVKFTFQDSRKKISQAITVIPNRLLVKSDLDNATIEAQIVQMTLPFTYKIEFKGFGKNEVFLLESSSYDEVMKKEFPNPGVMNFMPGVVGKLGGIAQLSIQRPSGEHLKLELPWGIEMMKYILYYDNGQIKSVIDNQEFLKSKPEIDAYFKSKRR